MNTDIEETDDPVMIAKKLFNGTTASARLWRKYLQTLAEKYHDFNKAQSIFMDAVYAAQSEIANDPIQDTVRHETFTAYHVHAKHFTKTLKKVL